MIGFAVAAANQIQLSLFEYGTCNSTLAIDLQALSTMVFRSRLYEGLTFHLRALYVEYPFRSVETATIVYARAPTNNCAVRVDRSRV